ncbi:MAG: hypothetical protein RIT04_353 [Candidatus Parcubacteria bacterium]
MNILFISKNLIAADIARILKNEGHEVKLFIGSKSDRENFSNIVDKTDDWKNELGWVGKSGLIVFDDVGYGSIQNKLRKEGYTVFGGSRGAEKLEMDREYGQEVFRKHGMKTVPLKDFDTVYDALEFAKANPNQWVIKQNNGKKALSYVGELADGSDGISVLLNFLITKKIKNERITLQQRIDGIEIGIGRYFNGTDWVGPIEFNLEHTKMFPGDVGPTTSEMGTLAWYSNDESIPLYMNTIGLFKDFLKKTDFRGDFEINCIVNADGVFPLEATTRFGSPIIHLHDELNISPWGEFLHAVASGKHYDLKWKEGYGIVVLLAAPPFPFKNKLPEDSTYGIGVFFDHLSKDEMKHVHFEGISARVNDPSKYFVTDRNGFVLYVTGVGKTIQEAHKTVYPIIEKIVLPRKMYRNDIGSKFDTSHKAKLIEWGYLK